MLPNLYVDPTLRLQGQPVPTDPMGLAIGQPIPGSRYVRSICFSCGAAIRVSKVSGCDLCRDCGAGHRDEGWRARGRFRSDAQYHGASAIGNEN